MSRSIRFLTASFLFIWGVACAAPGGAQEYPSRTVKLVVAYPPGGSTDTAARMVAEALTAAMGQAFVVENRPGAGGTIGAASVARSPADGYTLLFGASAETSIAPATMENIPYDVMKDFAPISAVGKVPFLLVATPAFPPDSVAELVRYAKAHPGEVNYSSFGNNTSNHLTGALFAHLAGIEMNHVPYRGSGPSIADLMAGHVQISFDTITAVLPLVRDKRLKALGVATQARTTLAPGVPTISESGIKDFTGGTWFGVLAPAGTPPDIQDKLAKAVGEALKEPDVTKKFADSGITPFPTSPDGFREFIGAEITKWTTLPGGPAARPKD